MGRDTTGRTRKTDSLDGFELWFEDLPAKPKKKPVSKVFSKPVEQKRNVDSSRRFRFIHNLGLIFQQHKSPNMALSKDSGSRMNTRKATKAVAKSKKASTSTSGSGKLQAIKSKILLPFKKFLFIMEIVIKKIKVLFTTTFTKLKTRGKGMPKSKNNKEQAVEKTAPKAESRTKRGLGSGILGLYMATVIASITFSTVFILIGTENKAWYYLVAPQATFAVGVLAIAFWKLAKNW